MGMAKSYRRPVTSATSMPRRVPSAMPARFASGRVQRLSSRVPSISSAISFTAISQLYRGLDVLSGAWAVLGGARRGQSGCARLFHSYDHGHECDGAAMLRMRQEIRCRSGAALMHVRQAAAGSLRPEECGSDTDPGEFVEAPGKFVALPRSF